jgi:glycosyltransferase involved in cell wall biosynthesis
MRILFLLTQDLESPSGLGRYRPMAEELVKLGNQVRVLALHPDFENLDAKIQILAGVEVHYVAPMHVRKKGNLKTYYSQPQLIVLMLQATFTLLCGALFWPADIIHIGKPHPMNGIAGIIAHFFQQNQLFVDCDDYEPGTNLYKSDWQRKVVQFFEYWVTKQANWITTNTHFNQKRLEEFGIPADRILYLPNGMVRARFIQPSTETLTQLRIALDLDSAPVVVYIGTLSRHSHNLSLLFKAFHHVCEVMPTTILLMVGGGEDFASLQVEADQIGLHQAIRFTGRIAPDQVVNYYSLGNVAVDPVIDDDIARGRSPLKLFEAWACGIPFVTADVGDRRSLAGEPPATLLAPAGDIANFAHAILSVLNDSSLAQKLSRRGLQRSERFEWQYLVNELETTYLKAMHMG